MIGPMGPFNPIIGPIGPFYHGLDTPDPGNLWIFQEKYIQSS